MKMRMKTKKSQKSKKKMNKMNKSNKKQSGGVAPSCVGSSGVDRYMNNCNQANIHNTKLEDVELDAAFKAASVQSGGQLDGVMNPETHPKDCGCGSKIQNFDQYMNNVASQLGQSGGGYSVNPEEMIAGLPVYQKYDDCCSPSIVGGKLKLSSMNSPGTPMCGSGASQSGGAKKSKKSKKSKSKKSKKSKKSRKSKSKKSKRKMKGGMYRRSKPAEYPDSYDTEEGNFSDDMTKRVFDETQPNYSVNQI